MLFAFMQWSHNENYTHFGSFMTESSRKIIPTWRNNESESLYQKVTTEEHKQRVSTGKFSSIFILQSEYYSFDFCGFPHFNQNHQRTRKTEGSIFFIL